MPYTERCAHSSVLINTSSGPHLLVVCGYDTSDLGIFDIKSKSWEELFNIPKNVTDRKYHSLSLWSVTPTTNWIIVFGGVTSYTDTAVIELRYTSNNDWSTSIVPLDQYQEKLQERRREWEASQPVQPEDRREIDRLTRVLQEREMELEEERREKEQVRNRLQQQLQQAQQQGQEREREAREREQNFQQQLQESQQQLQREVQQGEEREQGFQRQLQQAQQQLQESQERERGLEQQLRERDRQERESSWVVSRNDIRMTERILGRGGWGEPQTDAMSEWGALESELNAIGAPATTATSAPAPAPTAQSEYIIIPPPAPTGGAGTRPQPGVQPPFPFHPPPPANPSLPPSSSWFDDLSDIFSGSGTLTSLYGN
uniref:Uncharacterized protein n=2 Tax=Amphimedon queenslandica TaxID=400682 RepID=A0A1X7TSW5_AMPQE